MFADISPGLLSSSPNNFTVIGNTLLFDADDGTNGRELWKSDGTTAGTVLVADIRPGPLASNPANLTVMGNTLHFGADDGAKGIELWKSDGTTAGTAMVADLRPGALASSPANLTAMGNTLLFVANDGVSGIELWKSDGTTAGTAMAADILSGSGSSSPASLTPAAAFLFFTADDGASGRELWRTILGQPGTTVRVRDINPGAGAGLQAGVGRLLSSADNVRILMGANDGVNGNELWVSDGTTAGTVFVADINPASANSNPASFARAGNVVFFAANDGVNGAELWAVPLGTFGGAGAASFGSGCPGTGNLVPAISSLGLSVIGDASFRVRASQARASAPAVLLAHYLPGSLALGGGCTLYLGLPVSFALATTTDGAGLATIPLGIPNDPSLLGASVFFQWAIVDPNGAWLNLISLSDGLHVVIGG